MKWWLIKKLLTTDERLLIVRSVANYSDQLHETVVDMKEHGEDPDSFGDEADRVETIWNNLKWSWS